MTIFAKDKNYTFQEIVSICDKNGMTTVDCLKEENMVSVEEYENGEPGGECLFEFHRISEDLFKLTWQENPYFMLEKFK
ncbi:hypothetical protein COU03_00760 [bacterium (Candidatus Gribaldobacteria) CG10_big_fil_rev_8_21_14_0_10_41_12]|uniref:Uncharacterized protein n=1 Tax=bacterium (Candidatus Gribaldobacteria) CG10_big_fil_rev_8_21_14_0_10_41_12 TaxID=2014277 RepID=A0A2H0UY47_9BACT|nr:MAG: hypothetical protein COU03_00760 [bacterium (Candidatus Gribaldobacteria) CG10_big_fil_rev_8_21_14_0_10_41_12]